MTAYYWSQEGLQHFKDLLDGSSTANANLLKEEFAKGLFYVRKFPQMGQPFKVKGVSLNRKTTKRCVLITRYDAARNEVEILGFYYQRSHYTPLIEALV